MPAPPCPAADGAFTPLAPGSRHQREKLAVLSAFAGQALVAEHGFDATPALVSWASAAARACPDHWHWDGRWAGGTTLATRVSLDGEVERLGSGSFGLGDEVSRCVRLQPPGWRLPALLALAFAEDLLLLDADGRRVRWMVATLPSHWTPERAAGQALHDLWPAWSGGHCTPGRVERWSVPTGHPRLHAHPQRAPAPDAEPPRWQRHERQSLHALPGLPLLMLATRVDVQPLPAALPR